MSRLEDNEAVHIHLEKVNKEQWWENVLTHKDVEDAVESLYVKLSM